MTAATLSGSPATFRTQSQACTTSMYVTSSTASEGGGGPTSQERNHGSHLLLQQEAEPGFSAQTPVPRHCRAGCPTRGRCEAPRSPVTERCVCYLREGPQRGPVTAHSFRLSWESLCTKWLSHLTLRRHITFNHLLPGTRL